MLKEKSRLSWALTVLLALVFISPGLLAVVSVPGRSRLHKAFWNTDNGAGSIAISSNAAIKQYGTIAENNVLGGIKSSGLLIHDAQSASISTSTTLTPTSSFVVVNSTGGNLTWNGSPSIATTTSIDGTLLTIMTSTTSDITLTDSLTLQLSTTITSRDRVFSNPGDNIVLRFLSGVWYEVSFSTGH